MHLQGISGGVSIQINHLSQPSLCSSLRLPAAAMQVRSAICVPCVLPALPALAT